MLKQFASILCLTSLTAAYDLRDVNVRQLVHNAQYAWQNDVTQQDKQMAREFIERTAQEAENAWRQLTPQQQWQLENAAKQVAESLDSDLLNAVDEAAERWTVVGDHLKFTNYISWQTLGVAPEGQTSFTANMSLFNNFYDERRLYYNQIAPALENNTLWYLQPFGYNNEYEPAPLEPVATNVQKIVAEQAKFYVDHPDYESWNYTATCTQYQDGSPFNGGWMWQANVSLLDESGFYLYYTIPVTVCTPYSYYTSAYAYDNQPQVPVCPPYYECTDSSCTSCQVSI